MMSRRQFQILFTAALLIACTATRASSASEAFSQATTRALLVASGVSQDRVAHYMERLDQLGRECHSACAKEGDPRKAAQTVHGFLHRRVLRGDYLASASNLGAALDGGPFNCAAASALYYLLARRYGLEVQPMSVKGHVWCRVSAGAEQLHVETTCRDWFQIAARYAGVPDGKVSPAMAQHRRRIATARALGERELRAVFHFNRGVTCLREGRFPGAVVANLRALVLDPGCRVAYENLVAALKHVARDDQAAGTVGASRLLLWTVKLAAGDA